MLKKPTEEIRALTHLHAKALGDFIYETRQKLHSMGIEPYEAHAFSLNAVCFMMTSLIVEAINEVDNKLVIEQVYKKIQLDLNKIIESYAQSPNN